MCSEEIISLIWVRSRETFNTPQCSLFAIQAQHTHLLIEKISWQRLILGLTKPSNPFVRRTGLEESAVAMADKLLVLCLSAGYDGSLHPTSSALHHSGHDLPCKGGMTFLAPPPRWPELLAVLQYTDPSLQMVLQLSTLTLPPNYFRPLPPANPTGGMFRGDLWISIIWQEARTVHNMNLIVHINHIWNTLQQCHTARCFEHQSLGTPANVQKTSIPLTLFKERHSILIILKY